MIFRRHPSLKFKRLRRLLLIDEQIIVPEFIEKLYVFLLFIPPKNTAQQQEEKSSRCARRIFIYMYYYKLASYLFRTTTVEPITFILN